MCAQAPRDAFALDPDGTFVNHGSFGATPRAVLQARAAFEAQLEAAPSAFQWYESAALVRHAAARVAAFVGADPDDLVFVDNATTGVNAVLRGIDWRTGDRVVYLSHVYGAVRNAVAALAERWGVQPVEVALPFPIARADQVLDALRPALTGARLAVLDHITSPTGLVLPIEAMVRACHRAGVPVLVDGAHAPGHVPLDLTALGADAYTGNLHKWAFAPKGAAFLHMPDGRLPRRPLVVSHGWKGTFAEAFDWPGTRDPSAWLAAPTGLDLHDAWGGPDLMARNHALVERAAHDLADRWDVALPAPADLRGAMATLPLPLSIPPTFDDTRALSRTLWTAHRIEVPILPFAGRTWVRISAQIYNVEEDYERLGEAVLAVGLGG